MDVKLGFGYTGRRLHRPAAPLKGPCFGPDTTAVPVACDHRSHLLNHNVRLARHDAKAPAGNPAYSDMTARHGGTKTVEDDAELLSLLIKDAGQSGPLWTATPYWQGYRDRILRELGRNGLSNFRVNQILLKGFSSGGMPLAEMPAAPWKRALWRSLSTLPGVRQIVAEHRRVLTAEYERHKETRRNHARFAMDEIARQFPDLHPPAGITNGGADDAFEWRGHRLTPTFVMYLSRLADFHTCVPTREVTAVLEIGPGLALSSLAHMTINPHLRVIANIDIVPILYMSTQFLRSINGVDLLDYRALRDRTTIRIEPPANGTRIYHMTPWLLPKLEGRIDYFFNAYSFQEMEAAVCNNYAKEILRLVEGGALLHSMPAGHKPGAGGQRSPVTLEFLASLFAEKFSRARTVDGFWPRLFGGDPAQTRLLTR
jgi:putative sugar O-methyltransferase